MTVSNALEQVSRIISEGAITATQAAKLIPPTRDGRPTNPQTVARLILTGKLRGIRYNRKLLTSAAAITEMIAAQQVHSASSLNVPRSPAERRRASQQAELKMKNDPY